MNCPQSLRAALMLGASALVWSPSAIRADDLSSVREKAAICDPNSPLNCLKPAANGSIAVTGGGGGGGSSSVQYNTTQPPVASGATTTPQSDAKGNTYVTPAPSAPNFPTSLPDLRTTGQTLSAAAGSSLVIPLNGAGTLGLTFSGLTASGATVTFSASNDGGTTYTAISSFNAATGVASPTYSTDGQTRIDVGGRTNIKLTVTTGGTGSITVSSTASQASSLAVNTSPLVAQTALGRDIGAVEQFGAWSVGLTGTPAINNAQVNGVAVATGTGASNTGTPRVAVSSDSTFAITNTSFASTQSGAWNVGLLAGTAVVGKVGIDQTTPGTSNKVSIGTDGVVANSPTTGATLNTSQPSVTTTAAALAFSGTAHREVYNPAANTASIFIGATGVTTTTGWEIPPGASSGDLSRFSGSVFAVAASSVTVRLISY